MRNFKIAVAFLLLTFISISCQKESVEVETDPAILEDWTFSTDEFVSWSDIYDKYVTDNRKSKSSSQKIRSASEDEADIVNQITASAKMSADLQTISNEIGIPE